MRKLFIFKALLLSFAFTFLGNFAQAQHEHEHSHDEDVMGNEHTHGEEFEEAKEEGEFNPTEMIMHHINDSHGFHVFGEDEAAVSVPLPVILWTDNGLVTFMSSAFHHDVAGRHIVERDGMKFVNMHEKIYQLDAGATEVEFDADHHPINASAPLDLSITKNVFTLMLGGLIVCLIFMSVAASYKKNKGAPKGLAAFMEPLVVFIRDEVARPQIGEKKYHKYMTFLLTVFFMIWTLNLMGLVPFFPFSANLSGNIAFTLVLAVFSLIVVQFSGKRQYWMHILAPKPWWLWPILFPIELLSNVVTKFFALMIRLFANITAGHIIILSLISLIFIFKSVAMAAVAVPFALFISVLELLVAALQAYIFTMLTALFIGQAVAEDHH